MSDSTSSSPTSSSPTSSSPTSSSPTSSSSTSSSPTSSSERGPWLFHPLVDILVGCGLLALPLALLSDLAGAKAASMALVVAGALSVVVNGPHYAATVVRAWALSPRHRAILVGASVVAVVVVVAAHVWPPLLPVLFTAYLTWSPWHYATQNHGIGLVLLARDGGPTTAIPTANERRGLKLAHAAFAIAAVVSTHAGGREPLVWRAGIDVKVAFFVVIACLVVGVVCAAFVLLRLRKRGAPRRGLLLLAALVSTSLVWFVVPALLARGGSLLYAGGVVALLHCAQYLWITSFVEGRAAYVDKRAFDAFAWMGLVVAGGVVLFTVVPWFTSKALGYDLVISLLIVQAVANLHHFVVDAVVWKLRDPRVRAPILSGHERAAADRHKVSNLTALGWSLPAVALLLLGVVDVLQLAGTRSDAAPELALRAAVLNDNDSRVWVQSAQAAVGAGDLDAAKADLGRAVALSPFNADAQRALARLHVAAGRDDEAWTRFQAMPQGVADDSESRVLFAGVALRLEKFEDAKALASAALDADLDGSATLGEIEARRVLGTAQLELKQAAEARTTLKRALDDAQAALGYDPLARGQLLELGLALADANAVLTQVDPALALYDRVLDGAEKTEDAGAAFRALTAQGRVLDARGKPQEALTLWQRALGFVDQVKDPAVVAEAWLDYASLMARSDAPLRVRYACALKARAAAEKMHAGPRRDARLKFITEATRYVEEALSPTDAEDVRKDVDAAAKDALTLGYPSSDGADDDAPAVPPALQP